MSEGSLLKVKRLRPGARLPRRATPGSAACDLSACLEKDLTLEPGGFASVPTGIAIELPRPDLVALVFSRSGLGFKHGITLVNSVGVIDSDYRGEICVGLINHSSEPYTLRDGERVAQLMVSSVCLPEIVEAGRLSDTERGADGFGSTGK